MSRTATAIARIASNAKICGSNCGCPICAARGAPKATRNAAIADENRVRARGMRAMAYADQKVAAITVITHHWKLVSGGSPMSLNGA